MTLLGQEMAESTTEIVHFLHESLLDIAEQNTQKKIHL